MTSFEKYTYFCIYNTSAKNEYQKQNLSLQNDKNHNKYIYDCTLQLKWHESDICSGIENNFVMHAKHM